jgi:hypothetical protein
MQVIKYPSELEVDNAILEDEPLLILISFDGETVIMSHIDEAVEHHILLLKVGFKDTDIDKYFRLVYTSQGSDWTFVCPTDYKNISIKETRIERFYNDGFTIITETLKQLHLNPEIEIPRRYRRHLNLLKDDN